MKNFIFTATIVIFIAVGCSSDQKMPETAGKPNPVHVGMTKEEVLKTLGQKPKRIQTSPNGETWHYDNVELALIPFNFGFKPEFKNYIFDTNGILIDFNVSQPTK
jgi:hypothetical protein